VKSNALYKSVRWILASNPHFQSHDSTLGMAVCLSAKPHYVYAVIALFLFLCISVAKAQDQSPPISENLALAMVSQKIQDDGLYSSWTKIECLSFVIETIDNDYIDIAIHESHKGNCLGDPNTYPIVDRFRVLRLSKKMLWYNVVEGEFIDYVAKNIRR